MGSKTVSPAPVSFLILGCLFPAYCLTMLSVSLILNLTERIELLRSKLKESVAEEDYEAAAAYRDEIRALENKASGGEDQDEMV